MTIFIYGVINSELAASVNSQAAEGDVIRINSAGGDVFAGLSMYNVLKGKGLTIEIDGLCASAATLVAMAGQKIRMSKSARMMIHSPSVMLSDMYTRAELEKMSNTLSKVEESIAAVYKGRNKEFELPSEEVWYTAREALAAGLIDEISDEAAMEEVTMYTGRYRYELKRPTASIDGVIMDNMVSGAERVGYSIPFEVNNQAELIVKYANGGLR